VDNFLTKYGWVDFQSIKPMLIKFWNVDSIRTQMLLNPKGLSVQ